MKCLLNTLLITLSLSCFAQEQEAMFVGSIDGIVNELLELISLEKGEKMDTVAIRNLFYPSAQLTVLNHSDSSFAETVSLDEFLSLLKNPYYEQGYHEKEINKIIDEYNGIAQVFQSFYAQDFEGAEELGINSYQLIYYKDRWWIINLLWTIDSNGTGLPKKYDGK